MAEEPRAEVAIFGVLAGGIGDWVTAKLPTDSKTAPQPLAPATARKA